MTEITNNLFSMEGRVAIVTGAAGMLGCQFTRTLMSAGAKVVVADIRKEAAKRLADKTVKDTGGEALGLGVDVSSKAEVGRMVAEVLERWGRIDVLVNNAAVDPKFDADRAHLQSQRFEEYPLELWQQSLGVNLTGVFLCAQAVGTVMVQQHGGVIVNVSSTYGIVAPDQRLYQQEQETEQTHFKPVDYAVTKAAVAHLTRYLAAYWAGKNIRVNTLTPGGVLNKQEGEFVRKYALRTPLGRMAEKEELCGALLFLASDASSYMTGANLVVDGGWTAW